jgi:hypothetical protein
MAIESNRWVVICTEPLRGNPEETKYFDTKGQAADWATPRLSLYRQIDLAEVQFRALTALRPDTSIQRAD